MSKQISVLITSGGMISKIDDVRSIGNFSKGTTGALLAEEFLRKGVTVHYVYAKDTKRPFRHKMKIDPLKDFDEEVERVRRIYNDFGFLSSNLHEYEVEDFQDYYETVQSLVKSNKVNVAMLPAAVSDYGAEKQQGKISSDNDFLQLLLKKNEKVISLIKKWNPKVFLVGFKLLSDSKVDYLIDVAYKNGIKNHSNLTVANTVSPDFKERKTVFITPEKGLVSTGLADMASKLTELVLQRFSHRHYKTKVNIVKDFDLNIKNDIETFKSYVRKLWKLNLFEPYFDGADSHFGFLATRIGVGNEFLITSRGSNKKDITDSDIVHVYDVDFDKRIVSINTLNKKASLNANVAAKIFQERNDAKIILHSHVSLGGENRTSTDYSPGTEEDVLEVIKYLRNNESGVELTNHGIILLGNELEDIIKQLDVEPAYTKFSEIYDLIYGRFQKSSDFLDLIEMNVEKEETVLDLAAGTGEVSRHLIEDGYKNISLTDKNKEMLAVAQDKIGKDVPIHVTQIETMDIDDSFDAVVARQSINYLMDFDGLVLGFKNIHKQLNLGGRFIFNAPNYKKQEFYSDKVNSYMMDNWQIQVFEMNYVEDDILTHTQNSVLVNNKTGEVIKNYDINRFGMFTLGDFAEALKVAGFRKIIFYYKGLSTEDNNSKSLYCVATK